MTDPAALWKTQQGATFPASCLPLAIDGVKLVKLDAAAGAILTAALRTDGIVRALPESKKDYLRKQRELILRALAELPLDPDGRAYFERLAFLRTHVLMAPE
jgi:hypothetical protein